MYLMYYIKDGVKGWLLGETKENLQQWADKNLNTGRVTGDDEYGIVDLANRDLKKELREYQDKLKAIKELCK